MAEAWASIVRKDPAAAQLQSALSDYNPKSKQGLQTLVVDANAFIDGGSSSVFSGVSSYDLCTVKEVVNEIRDERARAQIESLTVPLRLLEPSPESISKVVDFARETGDLHVLSETDVKVIALAYALEVQAHGDSHLRTKPPPLVRSRQQNRQADLPGWGSNVPNPEEWDDIPEDDGDHCESRILGLKDLRLDAAPAADLGTADPENRKVLAARETTLDEAKEGGGAQKQGKLSVSTASDGGNEIDDAEAEAEGLLENIDKDKNKEELEKKSLQKSDIQGKLNVSTGVDASKGEHDEDAEWERVGCRKIRWKRKKRAARLAALSASEEAEKASAEEEEITAVARQERDEDLQEEQDEDQTDAASVTGVTESEESWGIRPAWASTVACLTTDFAMQNVILQMGLRLFTPTGLQVRELQRWVLKCHACGSVTREVERLFCPKCGNGGTLFRVSMTVGANGSVEWGSRRRRVSIRGTKYSLPLPKGGREGAVSNPVLREDQLPRSMLYPKTKKKAAAAPGLDTITSFDDVLKPRDKRSQNQSARRAAISQQLYGRRNPNDLHFNRNKK